MLFFWATNRITSGKLISGLGCLCGMVGLSALQGGDKPHCPASKIFDKAASFDWQARALKRMFHVEIVSV
jgi:hypothetical protein